MCAAIMLTMEAKMNAHAMPAWGRGDNYGSRSSRSFCQFTATLTRGRPRARSCWHGIIPDIPAAPVCVARPVRCTRHRQPRSRERCFSARACATEPQGRVRAGHGTATNKKRGVWPRMRLQRTARGHKPAVRARFGSTVVLTGRGRVSLGCERICERLALLKTVT